MLFSGLRLDLKRYGHPILWNTHDPHSGTSSEFDAELNAFFHILHIGASSTVQIGNHCGQQSRQRAPYIIRSSLTTLP